MIIVVLVFVLVFCLVPIYDGTIADGITQISSGDILRFDVYDENGGGYSTKMRFSAAKGVSAYLKVGNFTYDRSYMNRTFSLTETVKSNSYVYYKVPDAFFYDANIVYLFDYHASDPVDIGILTKKQFKLFLQSPKSLVGFPNVYLGVSDLNGSVSGGNYLVILNHQLSSVNIEERANLSGTFAVPPQMSPGETRCDGPCSLYYEYSHNIVIMHYDGLERSVDAKLLLKYGFNLSLIPALLLIPVFLFLLIFMICLLCGRCSALFKSEVEKVSQENDEQKVTQDGVDMTEVKPVVAAYPVGYSTAPPPTYRAGMPPEQDPNNPTYPAATVPDPAVVDTTAVPYPGQVDMNGTPIESAEHV